VEIIIIILIIGIPTAVIVWLLKRRLAKARAPFEAVLDDAWRVVLSDPNYMQRRLDEERKREAPRRYLSK
jgi:hypothetical protein